MLDNKRSNAINIGLTKLPPPRTIKAAVLKMDNSIINKEGIEVRMFVMMMIKIMIMIIIMIIIMLIIIEMVMIL